MTKFLGTFKCLAAAVMILGLSGMGAAQANDLVGMLTSQLGVSEEQASGGAGSILDFAKGQMGGSDFDIVSQSMPDLGSLVGGAADAGGSSASLVDSGTSLLGGSSGDLDSITGIASSFTDLGMSPDMVNEFVPVIIDYAKTAGSEQANQLLQGALSAL